MNRERLAAGNDILAQSEIHNDKSMISLVVAGDAELQMHDAPGVPRSALDHVIRGEGCDGGCRWIGLWSDVRVHDAGLASLHTWKGGKR